MIEASLDPLVAIGADGKITDVNEASVQAIGMPREKLIGTDFADYFTEPDKARGLYQQAFSQGTVRNCALELRHRDGRITSVLYNASIYRDDRGEVSGVFAAARDVTERKKAEAEREAFFRFFNASSDLMCIADPNGAFLRTNPACTVALGYTAAELVARPFIEFVHPEDRQRTLDEMAQQQRIGFSRAFENRYRCKDGTYRWLSWRADFVRAEGITFATARDVTELKRVENALRESEREFRSLADAVPQIVWATRPDGWNVYFNQRWMDYTGLTLEESYGHGWNIPFHPDDKKKAWDAWQEATQHGATYSLEVRLRRADGAYRWWLVRGVPLLDATGNTIKWFGTCTDIEDLKRAEEKIQRYAEELKRSNQELEHFAYVASHDLQEPLRTLCSFSQLLANRYRGRLDADADEFIGFIVGGAKRMQTLINDLLTFSRVGTKGKPFAPVDCDAVLTTVVANLKTALTESSTVLTRDPLPVVRGDETQLTQLFQNLLGNAIKFRRPEEPPRIHITASHRPDGWQFTVRDNGIGIDPQHFDRLFVIFQRLHGRDDYPGTGIGLAVCKKIVERHGGRVWVESVPGQGSAFHFTLPEPTADAP